MKLAFPFLFLIPALSFGQQAQSPPPGNPLRKMILDALRVVVQKDLGQKVIFQVDTIRVYQDWGLLLVYPLQPNSKPIDFTKTKYKEMVYSRSFDSNTYALLQKKKRKWVVRDWYIGATDAGGFEYWLKAPIRAPKELFPSDWLKTIGVTPGY